MHGHQHAVAARGGEYAQEIPVIDVGVFVGQEHFQAAHAGCDDFGDLLEDHIVGGIGNDLVERIVHHRLAGAPAVFRQGFQNALALELGRESDDAGRSAGQSRSTAGDPVFLIRAAVRLQLLDMAMAVYATGHDHQSVGLDAAIPFQVQSDSGDTLALDPDIGAEHVGDLMGIRLEARRIAARLIEHLADAGHFRGRHPEHILERGDLRRRNMAVGLGHLGAQHDHPQAERNLAGGRIGRRLHDARHFGPHAIDRVSGQCAQDRAQRTAQREAGNAAHDLAPNA